MEIRKAKITDTDSIVKIHCDAFDGFFLTSLGKTFLRFYYSCFINSDETIVLCAENNGTLLGFAAIAQNAHGFNSRLIKRNFIKFSLLAMKLLFTCPKSLVRLARNIRKTGNGGGIDTDLEAYAELFSIGVSPQSQGQGIGKILLAESEQEIKKRGVQRVSLTTDYYDNDSALAFYRSMGYEVMYEFIAYPDRKMYRLIKTL